MRTLTEAEQNILAAPHYVVHVRALVTDVDGVDVDLSPYFVQADWSEDIDQPIVQPRIQLRRDGPQGSLSPLVDTSPLNQRTGGGYAPLLDAGHRFQLLTATTLPGVVPGGDDWKLVFDGTIDDVELEGDPLVVTCRDWGGELQDRQIEDPQTYGTEEGVPLHVVMQQVLDDTLKEQPEDPSPVVLHVPEAPTFMVTAYRPDAGSLMEALQSCASVIAWDVRYAWDETLQSFRLALLRPDREKVVPDYTHAPNRYLDVTKLQIGRSGVRNRVQVVYWDQAAGEERKVTVQDGTATTGSIGRYGLRFMRLVEGKDSPIDTEGEALAMAGGALFDLKDPKAEHEIELRYWWPAELGDLYAFAANGVHYTEDQALAVVGIRHSLAENKQRTILACRGKPAGGFLSWHKRAGRASGGTDGKDGKDGKDGTDGASILWELDTAEDGATGTLWWRIVERTAHVVGMSIATVVGGDEGTVANTPKRGPGTLSKVRGGLLGALTYEHDVVLADDRFSTIAVTLTLDDSSMITLGPVAFDRNTDPTLVSASAVGRKVVVVGDSDTASVEVRRKGGGWRQHINGMSGSFDLSLPDGNGNAAMGLGDTWQVECVVYGEPREQVGPATKRDWRELTIRGESSAPDARWIKVDAYLPPLPDDRAALALWATDAPAGLTVRVWRQVEYSSRAHGGSGTLPEEDRTSALGIVAVPAAEATYYDALPWPRSGTGTWNTEVRVWYRAELLDGSTVVDSREVFVEYRTPVDVGA